MPQDTLEQSTTGWLSWSRSQKGEGSGEWSEAVLRSLITLKALTHLAFKRRRLVSPTPAAVAFALYLGHAAGFRGAEIFASAWLRVLDSDPSRARHLAVEAKRVGLLDLRMAGDVIELNLFRLDPSARA
jgi:hypothetical protein